MECPDATYRGSVSQSTSARQVCRSATLVGSSTAWNMAFSRTDRCPRTRLLAAVTTASTRSSARPELANTCQGPCSWIWSLQSSVRVLDLWHRVARCDRRRCATVHYPKPDEASPHYHIPLLQYTLQNCSLILLAIRYNPEGRGFDSRWCHWNFSLRYPSGRTTALGSPQPLTEMSTRSISW